jgi:hypothetical protein
LCVRLRQGQAHSQRWPAAAAGGDARRIGLPFTLTLPK